MKKLILTIIISMLPALAMAGTLSDVVDKFPDWIVMLTTIVTAATTITALTPSRSDDRLLDKVLLVLNFISGNFLNNKNADDNKPNRRR